MIKKIKDKYGVEHDIEAHTAEYAYKDARGRAIEETYQTKDEMIDYINNERMADVVENLENKILRGGREYHYSINLTAANTVRELVDELKSYEMFDENNEGKFHIKLSDDTILENIHIKWTYSDRTHFTYYYITSIIRDQNSIKVYADTINMAQEPLTISELIAQHKPVASTDYVDQAVANAGGKQVITADSELYNSIIDQDQTTQGQLYLNFSLNDFKNKYVFLDLAKYEQTWDDAQDIYCDFSDSSIKNATIIIKSPGAITNKGTEFLFWNGGGGALIIDYQSSKNMGTHFDINEYTNLIYDTGFMEFSFQILATAEYGVKIDFDDNGYAQCIAYYTQEI